MNELKGDWKAEGRRLFVCLFVLLDTFRFFFADELVAVVGILFCVIVDGVVWA